LISSGFFIIFFIPSQGEILFLWIFRKTTFEGAVVKISKKNRGQVPLASAVLKIEY